MSANKITIVPIGGLCNRMRVLDSAFELYNNKSVDVEIIWFNKKILGCSFHELFKPINSPNIKIIDSKLVHYFLYDKPRIGNMYIPGLFQAFIFNKIISEKQAFNLIASDFNFMDLIQYKRIFLATCYNFASDKREIKFESLIPLPQIAAKVELITSEFSEHTIGVHVRRTDHVQSIAKSPISLFVDKMKHEVSLNENTKFYLASDSIEVKKELINIFQNRIICNFDAVERDNKDGIQNAIIELYALSKTKKILGSYNSSFSIAAAEISGIELEMLTL